MFCGDLSLSPTISAVVWPYLSSKNSHLPHHIAFRCFCPEVIYLSLNQTVLYFGDKIAFRMPDLYAYCISLIVKYLREICQSCTKPSLVKIRPP